ncbi:MAG TPA: adenylosuccinate lyase [Planctomycetota bacterium]|nr:adenylosuccinate lyase [Planctomycetota bacterium]
MSDSTSAPKKNRASYSSPLTGRYGASEMSHIFSDQFKFSTWRRLWIALAEAERELGLPITAKQIARLKAFATEINFEEAEAKEKEIRHDVMAHVHAYGVQAPDARGIIHLGATSAYVADNTDLIQLRAGLQLCAKKIVNVIAALAAFAEKNRALPTLAYTHFQPAQPTTVGKRSCLWIQDLLLDLEDIEHVERNLPFLGVKGTTGTQASFLELFDGDAKKVAKLEVIVAKGMGFERTLAVSGQTYTRKLDFRALSALSGVAQSAHKFANDLRLLAHLKEIEEPFESGQVGSSAMAYKRNPMRAERMTGMARHVITLLLDPALTAAEQWFERTLDDSSNKRLAIPEAFLTLDIVLETWLNVAQHLVVYPAVMAAHLKAEMPFMMSENILMEAVKLGGDRQDLHERIRVHSHAAAARVKEQGLPNDLLERIAGDPLFAKVREKIGAIAEPARYVGLAVEQTEGFLKRCVKPVLKRRKEWLGLSGKVSV